MASCQDDFASHCARAVRNAKSSWRCVATWVRRTRIMSFCSQAEQTSSADGCPSYFSSDCVSDGACASACLATCSISALSSTRTRAALRADCSRMAKNLSRETITNGHVDTIPAVGGPRSGPPRPPWNVCGCSAWKAWPVGTAVDASVIPLTQQGPLGWLLMESSEAPRAKPSSMKRKLCLSDSHPSSSASSSSALSSRRSLSAP
mmetsp:Transcript_31996/g.101748  ORF Transcript_31996/g.101748 Transcript_31996/m.101748 type:complete len:205 (-) Transcript_31996:249-863(-)